MWQVTHHQWFSPASSKTDRYDITEILLKVALNTITLTLYMYLDVCLIFVIHLHVSFGSNDMLCYTFILLVRWISQQFISWHVTPLIIPTEFQIVFNLHSLYNAVYLAEKQKILMLWSSVSADQWYNIWSTARETNMLTISPLICYIP